MVEHHAAAPKLYAHTVHVEVHPQALHADGRPPRAHAGVISVTREPGGILGTWHRTALLYRATPAGDVDLQLHRVQIESWDAGGLVIAGLERHWRRKACTEEPQAWLVRMPGAAGGQVVDVYLLRHQGQRRDRQEVRACKPLRGLIGVGIEVLSVRPSRTPRRAVLVDGRGQVLAELADVQLQLWEARGLILAGTEVCAGRMQARQAWFVTIPGASARASRAGAPSHDEMALA